MTGPCRELRLPVAIKCMILLAGLSLFLLPVAHADNIFSSRSAVMGEVSRLGSEVRDIVTTPADIEGGLWGTLAVGAATGLLYVLDQDIHDAIQDNRSKSLGRAAEAGSLVGNPFLHLGLAAAVYGGALATDSAKFQDVGLMLGEAAILADASTLVLKQGIGRARPSVGKGKGSFRPFQFDSDFDSLPSMHAASSFAMASIIAGTTESLSIKFLSYGTAFFVGFSRMYEEKHWASDVLLGAAVGELCGRVVMNSHARKDISLRIAPQVSQDAVGIALLGHW